ncbi:Ubiquinone biosynthesis protein [Vanrija albida]|uniref:4-hydroxy-3-methoxy-5-polyprenylbenzoate decarboxylase n=1 Tax=Vanrija albida TaxID=181172 RepID=A0ABR3Q4G3_9TREE
MSRPTSLLLSTRAAASSSRAAATSARHHASAPAGPAAPPQPRKNYPDHVPLNAAQNALLAVGSGVVGVLNYTSRPDLIATLSESTASTFLPRLHEAMAAHPEGRQILRDRPTLSSATVSLDHLRGLRRGTVGREYVEWLDRDGFTPDAREKVRYIDSPSLAYTMLRYRQTHDLYHTLFSLPPTLAHELSLKVVEYANMGLPAAALSSLFGPARLSGKMRQRWVDDWVPWALRTGAGGRTLVGVYWEKRWEQGIGELRRELGVSRNDANGVEARWRGYRELREMERALRRTGEWVDEPEEW